MERKPISFNPDEFPEIFHPYINGARLFDSSCSSAARVIYIDNGEGLYLKSAPKGALKTEAEMTRFLNGKGLAPEVVAYESGEKDWLLSVRARGEDAAFKSYLDEPNRLCDSMAEALRRLHSMDCTGCPVPDRTKAYLAAAETGYKNGLFDNTLFPKKRGYKSAEEAWGVVRDYGRLLKTDTLIHGDYCLPNIILNNWSFSAFIDVGNGGVGDRHIDLFWGAWSLGYNLKTDKFADRFFDAYGRADVDADMLKIVAAAEMFG